MLFRSVRNRSTEQIRGLQMVFQNPFDTLNPSHTVGGQIARVIGFNTVAFMLGMLAFGALGLLWGAPTIAPLLHLSAGSLQGLAVAMLLSLAAFVALCHHRRVLA